MKKPDREHHAHQQKKRTSTTDTTNACLLGTHVCYEALKEARRGGEGRGNHVGA